MSQTNHLGVSASKASHVAFFMFFLPAASVGWAWILSTAVSAAVGSERAFLIDTVGAVGAWGVLYTAFDRVCWKWPLFRCLGVVDVPVLEGRWTGTIRSSYDGGTEISTALEIVQSFSHLRACLYCPQSQSASLIAGFVQGADQQLELHYEYSNEPMVEAAETMHSHPGTVVLRLVPRTNRLEGSYYNRGRDHRGHTGTMSFRFEGKRLMGTSPVSSPQAGVPSA
jgi:hypothetical protein